MSPLLDRLNDLSRKFLEWLGDLAFALRTRGWPALADAAARVGAWLGPRWKRYAIIVIVGVGGATALFTLLVFFMYLGDRESIARQLEEEKLWLYGRGLNEKKPPILIYARDGKLIGEYLPERGSHMTMNACAASVWLSRAAVAAEDREFYEHGGVSLRAIARAVVKNLLSFSLREGGGTISQQVARNLYTDRSRSLYRKLYETFTARLIEERLTKEEILCLYLNKIYMGEGRIGAEEASWFYFRKAPERLTAPEAAMIVGLFPSPVAYSPLNNIAFSVKKQRLVLDALVEAGHLSERDRNLQIQSFLKYYRVDEPNDDPGEVGLYGASRDFRFNSAPSANERVKNELYDRLPEDVIRAGGLKVYTTIDATQQTAALQAIRARVEEMRAKLLSAPGADPARIERIARRFNGVFISMDAGTGELLSVVGGYGVAEGAMTQRVWSMRRQPGSAIKGFLYAVALDQGALQVNSMVIDEPVNINGYRPRNWYGRYLGRIPLRRAVAMSVNTVAVRALQDVGVGEFRDRLIAALDLGYFDSDDRFPGNLSLALGAGEVTPLELAQLYAVIANGGRTIEPRLLTRIDTTEGETIWENLSRPDDGRLVLSEQACAETLKLMQYVFDEGEDGTVAYIGKRRAREPDYLPFPIAGKTGTVQSTVETRRKFPGMRGVRDAWFVGITPGVVSIVWLGQDEGAPFPGSGSQAASVWAEFAQTSLRGRVSGDFPEVEIIDPPEEGDAPLPGGPEDPLLPPEADDPAPPIDPAETNPPLAPPL